MPFFFGVLNVDYITVEKEASAEFIERKSRFIGYVKPVSTEVEARDFIALVNSNHREATHNVPAYVLLNNNIQRCSDDGEPSGTAGVPVLEVILKSGVKDVCVVVTRYFGGVLLGTGGLVRAYSHASKLALEAGGIITMAKCAVLQVEAEYSYYERLSKLLAQSGANIEDCVFSDNVKIIFSVREQEVSAISNKLTEMSNGRFVPVKTGEKYAKVQK